MCQNFVQSCSLKTWKARDFCYCEGGSVHCLPGNSSVTRVGNVTPSLSRTTHVAGTNLCHFVSSPLILHGGCNAKQTEVRRQSYCGGSRSMALRLTSARDQVHVPAALLPAVVLRHPLKRTELTCTFRIREKYFTLAGKRKIKHRTGTGYEGPGGE
jgi:hypothetical protein